MFEPSGSSDESSGTTPPPAADDRLWRHPSEIAAAARSGDGAARGPAESFHATNRHHRFSLGTVVVAGSLGALAMFGTLAAMGLISGVADPGAGPAADATRADAIGTPTTITTNVEGVVAVRLTTSTSTSYGAGLVLNSRGDIVTTLPASAAGSTAAIENADATWTSVEVIGDDDVTGLVVLRPSRSVTSMSSVADRQPDIAEVSQVTLGDEVRMMRPGVAAIGAGFGSGPAAQITSTNACVDTADTMRVGLLVLTSERRTGPAEVATDASGSTVVGLVVAEDDNTEDQMEYAIPADLAQRVGRQIAADGHAQHGSLDIGLATSGNDKLAVVSVDPQGPAANSGIAVGDELLSIDGHQVHSTNDVAGLLLGQTSVDTVSVVVRRDNRQLSMVLPVTSSGLPATAPADSTTTVP